MTEPAKTSIRHRQSLRLDDATWAAIDAARSRRPGNVSRNTWITEAITEKLQRMVQEASHQEEQSND
ncbi:hypothetical protein WT90_26125 [Burkholderia stagnalis]|nr:hypothetical protein WT90_26125 [Burkholderia stagnalis]